MSFFLGSRNLDHLSHKVQWVAGQSETQQLRLAPCIPVLYQHDTSLENERWRPLLTLALLQITLQHVVLTLCSRLSCCKSSSQILFLRCRIPLGYRGSSKLRQAQIKLTSFVCFKSNVVMAHFFKPMVGPRALVSIHWRSPKSQNPPETQNSK